MTLVQPLLGILWFLFISTSCLILACATLVAEASRLVGMPVLAGHQRPAQLYRNVRRLFILVLLLYLVLSGWLCAVS